MESSTSPIMMIGGQRSNNATPHHHHYYSTPSTEQPSSFLSVNSYGSGGGETRQNSNSNPTRRSSANALFSSHHGGYVPGGVVPSPVHHSQQHQPPSSRATPRSRGQTPSANSLGGESNVFMDAMVPPPTLHHLLPSHSSLHHNNSPTPMMTAPGGSGGFGSSSHVPSNYLHQQQLNSIGHGHNHLHDDSHININCDNSSHSISPPNSNSNTTVSCGSGNSITANIGAPTKKRSRGDGGLSSKCNNLNNNNHFGKEQDSEAYENYRNRTGSCGKNAKNSSITKIGANGRKKSILEEDYTEKHASGDITNENNNASKFKQRPPFINPNQEFLPICDSLFNILSLAIYFCDVVFNILTVYTWYKISVETESDFYELSSISQRNRIPGGSLGSSEFDERGSGMPRELMFQWSLLGLVFIALSCTISQCLSYKWYKESERRGQKSPDGTYLEGPPPPCSSATLIFIHLSLVSVLWRYFKLFIPVDLRFVKNEVRDLCVLRLVHAFCQAAPMLLLQLYLIWHEPGLEYVSDLTKVSTVFSLVSVCWALASFSKNIRSQNVHKLVLTWLGVICQFLWRLGTVTSRFIALSLYAVVYQYWVLVVIFLHFSCMLVWLVLQNIFHGEKMSKIKKLTYSAIIAVVYTVCYINVQESNSKTRIIIYYVTMFLENTLLWGVWLIAKRYEDEIWFRSTVSYALFFCFAGGVCFMALYYHYFHVKKLSYVYDAESSIYRNSSSIGGCSLINDNGSMIATICGSPDYDLPARGKTNGVIMGYGNGNGSLLGRASNKKKASAISHQQQFNQNFCNNEKGQIRNLRGGAVGAERKNKSDSNNQNGKQSGPLNNKTNGLHHPNVPGVFNCRFHPAMKKKKKPTTFVPPPAVSSANANNNNRNGNNNTDITSQAAITKPANNSSIPLNNEISLSSSSQLQAAAVEATIRHHENLLRASPYHHQQQQISQYQEPSTNQIEGNHHHPHLHHHHHHNIDYDNNSGSLTAHYDLPEYTGPGGMIVGESSNNGSASSAYGPIVPGYPGMIKGSPSTTATSGRMMVPFWRRPLSIMGSENEGSVSSRVDIHQKLQEKKQQQLAELKKIDEEIKQGILHAKPELHEINPQPVPVEKKQPWFRGGGDDFDQSSMLIPGRGHHQEILLDPQQYLMYAEVGVGGATSNAMPFVENGSGYYYNPEWPVSPSMPNYYEPLYQNRDDGSGCEDGLVRDSGTSPSCGASGGDCNNKKNRFGDRRRRNKGHGPREGIYKSYRIPSDIDSQMSIPRSYTLPTNYKRKFRKPVKTENFLPSTNSSDGDEDDSGEDPDFRDPYPVPIPSMHPILNNSTPEGPSSLAVPPTPIASSTPTNEAIASTSASHNNRQQRKIPETKL